MNELGQHITICPDCPADGAELAARYGVKLFPLFRDGRHHWHDGEWAHLGLVSAREADLWHALVLADDKIPKRTGGLLIELPLLRGE